MTPQQKIKHMILNLIAHWSGNDQPEITAENIDALYDAVPDKYDSINEIRGCGQETNLPCEWSSHYESKSVAAKAPDGSWVGWTYWYGGGKYGEPEAIDWIEYAYDLNCVEEEKLVTVQTFTKVEGAPQ